MKTFEEIENRRNELEAEMAKVGYTDEIDKEWKELNDEEMQLEMKEYAIAIGRNGKVTIFVRDMYECGWAINTKVNGKWHYNEYTHIVDAMKAFAKFARENDIKTCLVDPFYLDIDNLKEIDRKADAYREEEDYSEACMASAYGDDSILERYNRKHGIEKEYSPSNPWDAPGMKVSDFIR